MRWTSSSRSARAGRRVSGLRPSNPAVRVRSPAWPGFSPHGLHLTRAPAAKPYWVELLKQFDARS